MAQSTRRLRRTGSFPRRGDGYRGAMSSPPSSPRRATPVAPVVEAIESAEALDAPARAVAKQVRNTLTPGALKDAISGTWLGHALHPMLTDVVIGSFVSATLLDLVGGPD